jgi:hypothetical protein
VGDFYGTRIEIWAGLGPDLVRLALLKKKTIWADYEQLLWPFFSSFRGQKKVNNIVASGLKSCIK